MADRIGGHSVGEITPFFKNWRAVAGLALVIVIDVVWELLNEAPAIWDMAYHQLLGWSHLEAFRAGTLISEFASQSPAYPPLYYLQEALVFAWIPGSDFKTLIVNFPFILLTAWATYRISVLFLPAPAAGWASVLVLLFPGMAMVHREALLDGALAAWVTAGAWLILRSHWLTHAGWTIAFGLVCALGVLTKWTMPIYLFVPLVFGVVASRQPRRAIGNLMAAGLLALPLVLSYYLPNLAAMISRYPTTQQTGLIPWLPFPRHGEPGLNNLWGWIYYPRVLASYFLYFPLTVLFGVGLLRKRVRRPAPLVKRIPLFLWSWLIGGLIILIFLTPKDPRFVLPLIPPMAMLLLFFWEDKPRLIGFIAALALIQFVTFSLPLFRPVKLAFFELKGDRDYQSLQREWVLYANHYFHLGGPPVREDWRLAEILELIPEGARVGVLPTMPRFHSGSLQLLSVTSERNVSFFDFNEGPFGAKALSAADFLVAKTGHQGISFITSGNEQVMRGLREKGWRLLREWPLPDGTRAQLWQAGSR